MIKMMRLGNSHANRPLAFSPNLIADVRVLVQRVSFAVVLKMPVVDFMVG